MDYEIEMKEIPSQRIASILEKTTAPGVGSTLTGIFGEVFNHLKERGDEKLPEAYDAIQKWAADKGIKLGAPPREYYVTDPEGEAESAKWKTEVIWPID